MHKTHFLRSAFPTYIFREHLIVNKLAVIAHNINNSVVEQRRLDGYINATALTRAYRLETGKRRDVSEWLSNKRTQESLEHLSSVTRRSLFCQIFLYLCGCKLLCKLNQRHYQTNIFQVFYLRNRHTPVLDQ
jgi:hypothetical protein